MGSNYTPQAAVPSTIALPENGDKGNGLTFKTPFKQLADWSKWLSDRYGSLQWLNDNSVPQLKGNGGRLEYVQSQDSLLHLSPFSGVLQPPTDFCTWDLGNDYIRAKKVVGSSGDSGINAYFPVRLRAGSTIDKIRCRFYKSDTNKDLGVRVIRSGNTYSFGQPLNNPATTELATGQVNAGSTGQQLISIDPNGGIVMTDDPIVIIVSLWTNAGTIMGDTLFGIEVRHHGTQL